MAGHELRLIGSPNSPFVRKVRVLAAELGVGARLHFDRVDPRTEGIDLPIYNPLRKVPTLVRADGSAIYDSAVICDWLCQTYGGTAQLLPEGEKRWRVLTTEALADGALDAGIVARKEKMRDVRLQSADVIDAQFQIVRRVFDRLDADTEWRNAPLNLGQIAVGCMIGWLEFRFPEFMAQASAPALNAWHKEFSRRPSMHGTAPLGA